MKHLKSLVRLAIFALLAVPHPATGPISEDLIEASITLSKVKMYVALPRVTPEGVPVHLKIGIANQSGEEILCNSRRACFRRIVTTGPDGKPIPFTHAGMSESGGSVDGGTILRTGDTDTFEVDLSRWFAFERPGRYTLHLSQVFLLRTTKEYRAIELVAIPFLIGPDPGLPLPD